MPFPVESVCAIVQKIWSVPFEFVGGEPYAGHTQVRQYVHLDGFLESDG
jgi:hypothetical protein